MLGIGTADRLVCVKLNYLQKSDDLWQSQIIHKQSLKSDGVMPWVRLGLVGLPRQSLIMKCLTIGNE